ncbi:MAG: sulfopyruvate decarboxylase subunit alpha [Planctomycetes bacterium]|nr:sulfopyruvate decarboxylase subunit alpha [Planctomycetota bacterium]
MSHANAFLAELKKLDFDFFTGVPCSFLKDVFTLLESEPRDRYVCAVREDAAIGFAAGAWFGGRRSVVLMQNSGLGVSVSALQQLHNLYEIPVLLVVSWRGYGGKDAPEHLASGAITEGLLDVLKIPHVLLDPTRMAEQLRDLAGKMEERRKPVALLVPPEVLE